jgi:hypothetical protein
LEGPDRRLRLVRKHAIDRAGVKPEFFQMSFRHLDVS